MAFCSNCGTEAQGRFCAKCGSPIGGGAEPAAPPPPGYTAPPQGETQQQSSSQQNYSGPSVIQASGLTDNMAAALCYVLGLLSGVLFLVLAPYNQNRTIRFHAFQSIFVHVGIVVVFIGLIFLTGILHLIPFVGALVSFALYFVLGLGSFFLWLALMYKAYNNERWVLPVVGPLAEKQAQS